MEIRSLKAALYHANQRKDRQRDRQTDMIKLKVTFRNFPTSPGNDF